MSNNYAGKFVSAETAVKAVQPGDWVDYGFGAGFPELLDRALAARRDELTDVKIRGGLVIRPRIEVVESDPEQKAFSYSWSQFLKEMEKRGYTWKLNRKYISLKAPGMERYIRLRSLGKNYSEEEIRGQILQPKVKRVYQKAVQIYPKKKLTGIQALYYSYLYQMGVLPKRPKRSPYVVREDIRKLDRRIEQIEFLMKHDITTREQLAAYREPLQKQIAELMKERRKLYRNDNEDSGKVRLSEINEELKNLRKEVRMTVRIEKHSLEIEERLRKAEEQNQNEKRVEHKGKESQEVR